MKAVKQVWRLCSNPDGEDTDLTQVGVMGEVKSWLHPEYIMIAECVSLTNELGMCYERKRGGKVDYQFFFQSNQVNCTISQMGIKTVGESCSSFVMEMLSLGYPVDMQGELLNMQ